jgi:hypothetical protein
MPAMVRTTSVNGKEYYVITTSIEAGGIKVPVQMYIDVNKLSNIDKYTICRHANLLLDHPFKASTPQPKAKKPWYQFW